MYHVSLYKYMYVLCNKYFLFLNNPNFIFKMAKMTPLQKISTWLDFKRSLPKVPSKQRELLIDFMKTEINFQTEDFEILADNAAQEESLLPEIEAKHGRSFSKWILPPTSTCLECGAELTMCRDTLLKPTKCIV